MQKITSLILTTVVNQRGKIHVLHVLTIQYIPLIPCNLVCTARDVFWRMTTRAFWIEKVHVVVLPAFHALPVSFWQNCHTKDRWVKWQQRHCYCFPMHLQYRFAKCPYFREKEYLLKLNAGNVRWVLASVS